MTAAYRVRAAVYAMSVFAALNVSGVAQAQTAKHHGIIHRHPTASAAVAGVAAHHYAKTRKHGLMHRHPVATGVAAAAVTHHYAKKK